jgi:hypothetical protein
MGGRTLLGALEAALGPANAAAAAACSDPVLRTARAAIDRRFLSGLFAPYMVKYIPLIRTVYGQANIFGLFAPYMAKYIPLTRTVYSQANIFGVIRSV